MSSISKRLVGSKRILNDLLYNQPGSYLFPFLTKDVVVNHTVTELSKYGLMYEDLYWSHEAYTARSWLPRELQQARERRLDRAFDLSMKRQYTPQDFQDKWTPLHPYLEPYLNEAEALVKETEELKNT